MSINSVSLLTNLQSPDTFQVKNTSPKNEPVSDKYDKAIRQSSEEFEAVFIGEMLKHAGVEDAFGADVGAFSYILLGELSSEIARTGDFGFAEEVYEHLKRTSTENPNER